jgi:manganese/zinc/iron transport system permease protein
MSYTLQVVILGGALLGLLSGVVGCFAVLRQQSLVGDALSHAALPGVALAFLLVGRDMNALLVGAGVAAWLATQFISALTHTTRLKQDTALGIALVSWFAIGIALLSYIQGRPDASQAGLDKFIFGQAAAMRQQDLERIAVVGVLVLAVLGLFWKELKLLTFDYGFALANGYPVRLLEGILMSLTVVVIVLGLQLAGVILMVGMLIAPAIAARQWTNRLSRMVALSALFGASAGAVGALISGLDVNLPTGPLMIVVASLIVAVSILFAPQRGVLWMLLQRRNERKAFSKQLHQPKRKEVQAHVGD